MHACCVCDTLQTSIKRGYQSHSESKCSREASPVKLVFPFRRLIAFLVKLVFLWSYKSASGGVPSLHVCGTGTNARCNQIAMKVSCKKILIEREASQVHLNTSIKIWFELTQMFLQSSLFTYPLLFFQLLPVSNLVSHCLYLPTNFCPLLYPHMYVQYSASFVYTCPPCLPLSFSCLLLCPLVLRSLLPLLYCTPHYTLCNLCSMNLSRTHKGVGREGGGG